MQDNSKKRARRK